MSSEIIKNPAFRHIGIMGRANKATILTSIYQLCDFFHRQNLPILIDHQTYRLPSMNTDRLGNIEVVERNLLGEKCDLVVVVGGDGSLLQSAQVLAKYPVPVVGVNRGRLGFLADINPDDLPNQLSNILNGSYQLDRRFLLKMEIWQGSHVIYEDMALNDVVLHAGKSVHMLDFNLKIDGLDVYRQHSDGLIVSTPTGSTAYALSGGGAILHPSLDAISLVPMHPHTLSSRPIVVCGSSVIKIRIHKDNRTQPMVSADGKASVPLNQNQRLIIRKHPDRLTLLHPLGVDFFEACRTKLGWNTYAEEFSLDS
ncbi:inorganic polyphosphate/ATP-NAD kinase [Moraxella macacae 0408225]|uniref:NAD kinase n=1 Tax=Moraxella macacae 0408225 TaxID=1230338 RepID=L2F850_9GAMM|nr:NAD(+) kinase [Moraxella macacae]ELA08633.1 inorganic polyphosphate/ATP-NAD kinase [Moraxella macacae 0408225]